MPIAKPRDIVSDVAALKNWRPDRRRPKGWSKAEAQRGAALRKLASIEAELRDAVLDEAAGGSNAAVLDLVAQRAAAIDELKAVKGRLWEKPTAEQVDVEFEGYEIVARDIIEDLTRLIEDVLQPTDSVLCAADCVPRPGVVGNASAIRSRLREIRVLLRQKVDDEIIEALVE